MVKGILRSALAAAAIAASIALGHAQSVYTAPVPPVIPAQKTMSIKITSFGFPGGTFTTAANTVYALLECVGGGGSGGGAAGGGASGANSGGGGGAGAYVRVWASAAQLGASQTVTVGGGGNATAAGNNVGNNGGQSSVGTLAIAPPGSGGGGSSGGGSFAAGGAGGTIGTGIAGQTFGVVGNSGSGGDARFGSAIVANTILNAQGGSSYFGGNTYNLQGAASSAVNGATATGFGNGGGGGASATVATAAAGGAGAVGQCVITEYIFQ